MTLDTLFELAKQEWIRAKQDKKHPFRFFTLATVSSENLPKTRMVVLRNFDSQTFQFTIYTDARSGKVMDLKHQNNAQLFFYHSKKKLQLIVHGTLREQDTPQTLFLSQPEVARKDYTSVLPPGTPFNNEEGPQYESDKNYFMRLVFQTTAIELLQLNSPHHLRALFTPQTEGWRKEFLVP